MMLNALAMVLLALSVVKACSWVAGKLANAMVGV